MDRFFITPIRFNETLDFGVRGSYVRVIRACNMRRKKSNANLNGLAVLFLTSVFPEERAKREVESGDFSSRLTDSDFPIAPAGCSAVACLPCRCRTFLYGGRK